MIPIPVTWYAIAALVVTNVITGVMWRSATHDLHVLQLEGEIATHEAARVVEEQKQITKDTENGWKAALDYTRADWTRRLRDAHVQPMPGISGPPGGADGLPADALALAAQCAETTKQLIALQDWVRKQERVK